MNRSIVTFSATLCLLVFGTTPRADEYVDPAGYHQAVACIHLDSTVSGGENTPEMLAAVAKNAGAEVAFLTDHDTQKATYGIWPFRNILKISINRASVRKYGIERYLSEIKDINSRMKDFVFLPGIEAVPFYSWKRELNGTLTLSELHRHVLVLGLNSADDIAHLPSIENGYPSVYTRGSLAGLVWLFPFIAALFIVTLPSDIGPLRSAFANFIVSWKVRFFAYLLLAVSMLSIANAYPFSERTIDQYGPDPKGLPYQELVDYVNARGGLTFLAHPEAEFDQRIGIETGNSFLDGTMKFISGGGIRIHTEPDYFLLNDVHDYTGFSVFYEGYRIVGKPEGLWDSLLMQFCAGRRARPLWAIAELDLEEGTDPDTASGSQTILLVRGKTPKDYLDALRNGRMYAVTAHMNRRMVIRDYSVVAGDVRAISGEVVPYLPDARLVLDLDVNGPPLNMEIVIIANGKVFARKQATGSTHLEIPLPRPGDARGYVRVAMLNNNEMFAVTNPIFLQRETPK